MRVWHKVPKRGRSPTCERGTSIPPIVPDMDTLLIGDTPRVVDAHWIESGTGTDAWIPSDVLTELVGWRLTAEGLCRGDACMRIADRAALERNEMVSARAVAEILERPVLIDAEGRVVVFGEPRAVRREVLESRRAVPVEMVDLNGNAANLDAYKGKKRIQVTFATWCGCAYDLPDWQRLNDELSEYDFQVVAIALDDSPEVVRPLAENVSIPVLVDTQHRMSEVYAISNVPTVQWVDEHDEIVVTNVSAFSNDMWTEVHGIQSGPHLDALRRWVTEGTIDETVVDPSVEVADLSAEEERARLHFRAGAELLRAGRQAAGEQHLREAIALAPLDFSIARAAMPLLGGDPFGEEFFALYDRWNAAGAPFHGVRPRPVPAS